MKKYKWNLAALILNQIEMLTKYNKTFCCNSIIYQQHRNYSEI